MQDPEPTPIPDIEDIQAQRRKHGLNDIDSRRWRTFTYEQTCGEATVFYQDGMVVENIKAWTPFEVLSCGRCLANSFLTVIIAYIWQQWFQGIFSELAKQSEEYYTYHQDPYTLHAITIERFDYRLIEIMADVRNLSGEHLDGRVTLLRPDQTTKIGLMSTITVCKLKKAVNGKQAVLDIGNVTGKYMVVTAPARIWACQLEFLELPTGTLAENGEYCGYAACRVVGEMLGRSPWRVLNMSEAARSGSGPSAPGLREVGIFGLGVGQIDGPVAPSPTGALRGAVCNRGLYEHIQIMLYEYQISEEEFGALEKKLRYGFMEERTGQTLPSNGSDLRLIHMRNMPWACVRDINITLAWLLYKSLVATQRIVDTPY